MADTGGGDDDDDFVPLPKITAREVDWQAVARQVAEGWKQGYKSPYKWKTVDKEVRWRAYRVAYKPAPDADGENYSSSSSSNAGNNRRATAVAWPAASGGGKAATLGAGGERLAAGRGRDKGDRFVGVGAAAQLARFRFVAERSSDQWRWARLRRLFGAKETWAEPAPLLGLAFLGGQGLLEGRLEPGGSGSTTGNGGGSSNNSSLPLSLTSAREVGRSSGRSSPLSAEVGVGGALSGYLGSLRVDADGLVLKGTCTTPGPVLNGVATTVKRVVTLDRSGVLRWYTEDTTILDVKLTMKLAPPPPPPPELPEGADEKERQAAAEAAAAVADYREKDFDVATCLGLTFNGDEEEEEEQEQEQEEDGGGDDGSDEEKGEDDDGGGGGGAAPRADNDNKDNGDDGETSDRNAAAAQAKRRTRALRRAARARRRARRAGSLHVADVLEGGQAQQGGAPPPGLGSTASWEGWEVVGLGEDYPCRSRGALEDAAAALRRKKGDGVEAELQLRATTTASF